MTTMRYLIALFSILAVLLNGCSKKSTSRNPIASDAPIMKVAVFADGRITADGYPIMIDSLRESFRRLAERKGVVWYYREASNAEPPPQAMQVMRAVVEAGLAIRLSSRPDYLDVIGPDGRPIQK